MPTDYTGTAIEPGDRIAYPVRRGSRMWLNEITVERIDTAGAVPVIVGYSPDGRRTRLKNAELSIVLNRREAAQCSEL